MYGDKRQMLLADVKTPMFWLFWRGVFTLAIFELFSPPAVEWADGLTVEEWV